MFSQVRTPSIAVLGLLSLAACRRSEVSSEVGSLQAAPSTSQQPLEFQPLLDKLGQAFKIEDSRQLGLATVVILPDIHEKSYEVQNSSRVRFLLSECGADAVMVDSYLKGTGGSLGAEWAEAQMKAALLAAPPVNLLGTLTFSPMPTREYEQFYGPTGAHQKLGFETSTHWIPMHHAGVIGAIFLSILDRAETGNPPVMKLGDRYDADFWTILVLSGEIRKVDPTFPEIREEFFDIGNIQGEAALLAGDKAQEQLGAFGILFRQWIERRTLMRNEAAVRQLLTTVSTNQPHVVAAVVGKNHMKPALREGSLQKQLEAHGFSWIMLDLPQVPPQNERR